MGDLKIFSKNEKEINSLVSTVQAVSKDIGMEFGKIKKCGMLVLKRLKPLKSHGIKLNDVEVIKEIWEGDYKNLGIIEVKNLKNKR